MTKKVAVISGFGKGLAESLAIKLISNDYSVIGLSRSGKVNDQFLSHHEHFERMQCDITKYNDVENAFSRISQQHGDVSLVIHNAAQLLLDDFLAISSEDFEILWRASCLGAVNVSQQVLPSMLSNGTGTLIFTGATASIKAGSKSAAFASAKFALRGLAQSLARASGPSGIHVIHTIIDGVIWGERAKDVFGLQKSSCLTADAVADSYIALIKQPSSAWTHEIDLRPFNEVF